MHIQSMYLNGLSRIIKTTKRYHKNFQVSYFFIPWTACKDELRTPYQNKVKVSYKDELRIHLTVNIKN